MSNAATPSAGSGAATDSPSTPTSYFAMAKQTWSDFSQDNAMRLAAAMACYVMLALAPLIVVAFKAMYLVLRERTDDVIREQTQQLIGAQAGEAIGQMVLNANKSGGGTVATVVSLVLVLFSASGVFMSLQDALNTIWEVKPKPNAGWWQFIRKRFLSMGMVLGIAVLLMSSMLLTAILHVVVDAVFGKDRSGFMAVGAAYALDFVVTIAVAWALFMAVFRFLPDAKVAWKDVWVGGLVTAVLFKLGQIAMAIYFNHGATSAYGTFGSIVAVLLWAYYSSIIMFLGAEFTQVWAAAHGRWIEPETNAVRVTEEERARQGIPSPDRVANKTAAQSRESVATRTTQPVRLSAMPPRVVSVPSPSRRTSGEDRTRQLVLAGAGLLVGAVAGALGATNLRKDPTRVTRKHAAAVHLDERIHAIESKLGRASRMTQYLNDLRVSDRIDKVEKSLRHATMTLRAEQTGRPKWLVRLGDLAAGR